MIPAGQEHETKVAVILLVKGEKMPWKLAASCVRMITYKPAQATVRKKVIQPPGRAQTRND
jgi:hypothetical protein